MLPNSLDSTRRQGFSSCFHLRYILTSSVSFTTGTESSNSPLSAMESAILRFTWRAENHQLKELSAKDRLDGGASRL
jgi:hypothetical protein